MSGIDGLANLTDNKSTLEQSKEQAEKQPAVKPFYRQFTPILMGLLFFVLSAVGLTCALFYQYNFEKNSLIANQLVPLQQELQHIKTLQKADALVSNLLNASNAENFVEIHKALMANITQLLQQRHSISLPFHQWLNEYKLKEDIVSRLQDSALRNQELKENGIMQLQLMLLSIQSMIDKQSVAQPPRQTLLQGVQASEIASNISVHHVNSLQQLEGVLVDLRLNFEQLNMLTPTENLDNLRIKIEQLFFLQKQIINDTMVKVPVGVNQQFEAFKNIVLTKQNALAKWQGYIRLAQEYRLELQMHQQEIRQLIATPYDYPQVDGENVIHVFLSKFDINLSTRSIVIILTAMIGFLLFFFVILLWQLRTKIKVSIQNEVGFIKNTFNNSTENLIANFAETQEIMQLVNNTVKPLHDEQEYQSLYTQHKSAQQLLSEQIEKSNQLALLNEQLQLDSDTKNNEKLTNELNHYASIEAAILSIIQKHQVTCINPEIVTKSHGLSMATQLNLLCQQLAQFRLALSVQSGKSRLKLNYINLVTELEATLFNKQLEQKIYNNQLFLSFDEQLLSEVKIDFLLFQQLISLFVDIVVTDRSASQIHIHVKLHDKSVGQQLVNISARVTVKALKILPDLVTQLVRSQSSRIKASPSVEVFSVLLAKQHGGNIAAQLVDDGYQLSFELPFAITENSENTDKLTIENKKVILLTSNAILAELIENAVLHAKGKFERLAVIESIEHYLTEKYLSGNQLDVFVITSDIAIKQLDYINQKIRHLPHSMKPKLMVLQSQDLSYERFGFYTQAESVFCQDTFIENILRLLASNQSSNQLFTSVTFVDKQYISTQLPLLLGVNSPQHYQNLQRLLHWLGLDVQVVSHEFAQKSLWQTGRFCLLITEFMDNAFLEMANKPQIDIGVFSLTNIIPKGVESTIFANWHLGKLTQDSTLTELIEVLSPWLKLKTEIPFGSNQVTKLSYKQENGSNIIDNLEGHEELALLDDLSAISDDLVITQVADVYSGKTHETVFDFSDYLYNQGSVELALFMLEEYTQDNHQQLNELIEAIKANNNEEAKIALAALTLNAKILAASALQILCVRWQKRLSRSEISNDLEGVNVLIKDTRRALNDIDSYAETL